MTGCRCGWNWCHVPVLRAPPSGLHPEGEATGSVASPGTLGACSGRGLPRVCCSRGLGAGDTLSFHAFLSFWYLCFTSCSCFSCFNRSGNITDAIISFPQLPTTAKSLLLLLLCHAQCPWCVAVDKQGEQALPGSPTSRRKCSLEL